MSTKHNHAKFAARLPAFVALASALLFGASTPAAKLVIAQSSPQLLAGMLYLGSGVGMLLWSLSARLIKSQAKQTKLRLADLPWLASAVISGGIIAPLLLMIGLNSTAAGAASLLLNLEAVFTALLAWFAFKENFDRRLLLGMAVIVAGSAFLGWQPGSAFSVSTGSLAIVAACFCWALDNSFTRNIAEANPVHITATKGLVAGTINCGIALALGNHLPAAGTLVAIALIGFIGYGVSLVLFITALKDLGAARAGAYFSTAPFAGAALSIIFLHEPVTTNLLIASALMAFGVWLHLTENHEHEHSHAAKSHEHLHLHDEHHQHEHDENTPAGELHSHLHTHVAVVHLHPHYPDSQHRHDH